METRLAELRDVIELGTSDYMFKNGGHRFCKIIDDCPDDQLLIDLYTKGYTSDGTIRRYRKHVLIGDLYVYDTCIIYQHVHHNRSMMSRIKSYIKDSHIKFIHIGRFFIFENELNVIKTNEPILLNNNKTLFVKLEYTQIGNVCVPSKRSSRLFAYFRNSIYVEKRVNGTRLSYQISKELTLEHLLDLDLQLMPILYSSQYNHKSIADAEAFYAEEMVKVLTK